MSLVKSKIQGIKVDKVVDPSSRFDFPLLNNLAYTDNLVEKYLGKKNFLKEYLGKGTFGYAYLTKNGTVYKFTKNEKEAAASLILFMFGDKLKTQGKIYKVYEVVIGSERLFIIEKEYVKPIGQYIEKEFNLKAYQTYKPLIIIEGLLYSQYDNFETFEKEALEKADDEDAETFKIIKELFEKKNKLMRSIFEFNKLLGENEQDAGIPLNDQHVGNIGVKDNRVICFDCVTSSKYILKQGGMIKNEIKKSTIKSRLSEPAVKKIGKLGWSKVSPVIWKKIIDEKHHSYINNQGSSYDLVIYDSSKSDKDPIDGGSFGSFEDAEEWLIENYVEKQKASNVWLDASVNFGPPNETPPSDRGQIKAAGGSIGRNSNNKDTKNINRQEGNISLKDGDKIDESSYDEIIDNQKKITDSKVSSYAKNIDKITGQKFPQDSPRAGIVIYNQPINKVEVVGKEIRLFYPDGNYVLLTNPIYKSELTHVKGLDMQWWGINGRYLILNYGSKENGSIIHEMSLNIYEAPFGIKENGGDIEKDKRYAVTTDMYSYAPDDQSVIKKSQEFVGDLRKRLDNQASIVEIVEAPFGSIKTRKLENVPKYENGGNIEWEDIPNIDLGFEPSQDWMKLWEDFKRKNKLKVELPHANPKDRGEQSDNAYFMLRHIVAIKRGNWLPDWNNSSEYKYYPWFWMDRKPGFAFGGSSYDSASARVGSRLCFPSAELCEAVAREFLPIYKIYFTKK